MIWEPCNIYPDAVIGENVSVGAFTEIGRAVIGDNVRIGKGCFICEGVVIENDCFIGPHVCFTNDQYPPSPKEEWKKTVVRRGARIGAGVTIICGLEIGEGALVGAGSTVTRSVPPGETWAGCPARCLTT